MYTPIFKAQLWVSPRPKRTATHAQTTVAAAAKQFTATFVHDYPREDGKGFYDYSMRVRRYACAAITQLSLTQTILVNS